VDPVLYRSYLATVYELPTETGVLSVSMDGEPGREEPLPPLLSQTFAILTAYNPRSMLLPRRVNEARHQVLRDLLVLGCYRVEQCLGIDDGPDGVWREPAWLVHAIDRDEAVQFGRVFRQNTIVYCRASRPELIASDPTCDVVGKTYQANWRVRS
jgi:hypothetical protein